MSVSFRKNAGFITRRCVISKDTTNINEFIRASEVRVIDDEGNQLGVMDLTAICLCRDHGMPLRVFQMDKPGALLGIVMGEDEGTLISHPE